MKKIEIDLVKFKKLYDSNLSLDEIAHKLGADRGTLYNRLRVLGWKREPRFKRVEINLNKVLELKKLGMTKEEIIKKLHVDRRTFVRFEKKNGIYEENQSRLTAYYKGQQTLKERKKDGLKPIVRHNWTYLDKYKDDIQEMLWQGIPRTKIAKKYNVCISTIYNFILTHDLETPVFKKLDNKNEQIISLYNQGKSLKTIAKEVGCCVDYLEDKIKELHLSRTIDQVKYDSYLGREEDTIIKLYQSGALGTEIAKALHVHPVSIYRKIKALKLKRA